MKLDVGRFFIRGVQTVKKVWETLFHKNGNEDKKGAAVFRKLDTINF